MPFEWMDPAHDEAVDNPVLFVLQNATGHVEGGTGIGGFQRQYQDRRSPDRRSPTGTWLAQSRAGAVLMVVRYHASAIPGMIPQQISTFDGGCAINNCEDLQLVVHEP